MSGNERSELKVTAQGGSPSSGEQRGGAERERDRARVPVRGEPRASAKGRYHCIDPREWGPCGQCVACRTTADHSLIERCMMESAIAAQTHFLTVSVHPLHYDTDAARRGFKSLAIESRYTSLEFRKLLADEISSGFKAISREQPNEDFRYFVVYEEHKRRGHWHAHALIFGNENFDPRQVFDVMPGLVDLRLIGGRGLDYHSHIKTAAQRRRHTQDFRENFDNPRAEARGVVPASGNIAKAVRYVAKYITKASEERRRNRALASTVLGVKAQEPVDPSLTEGWGDHPAPELGPPDPGTWRVASVSSSGDSSVDRYHERKAENRVYETKLRGFRNFQCSAGFGQPYRLVQAITGAPRKECESILALIDNICPYQMPFWGQGWRLRYSNSFLAALRKQFGHPILSSDRPYIPRGHMLLLALRYATTEVRKEKRFWIDTLAGKKLSIRSQRVSTSQTTTPSGTENSVKSVELMQTPSAWPIPENGIDGPSESGPRGRGAALSTKTTASEAPGKETITEARPAGGVRVPGTDPDIYSPDAWA